MKKVILYILLITTAIFSASCHKKQVQEKPENLISQKTMVNLIAESYIIESYLQVASDTLNRFRYTSECYHDLFYRYKVTREQFVNSMNYYLGDEDTAEKLLAEASAIIARKHKEYASADSSAVQQALWEEQQRIDSLAQIENEPIP